MSDYACVRVGSGNKWRRRTPRRHVLSRTVAVLAALVVCAQGAFVAASDAAPRVRSTTLCGHNGHLIVHDSPQPSYQIRNPYWHGQRPMCVHNRGGRTNFVVTKRPGHSRANRVVAYPDIFRGCIWNICSPHSRMPIKVSRIHHLMSTWHTRERAAGMWSAAYDIWFGKRRMTTGQANGAELMIWINEHGGCCALQRGAPKLRIDGRRFWLSHWRARSPQHGTRWNYIQFRVVRPTWRVDHLRLMPFLRRCERRGLIRRSWWMENVEAGYELWSGGRGLATTKFSVGLN